MKRFVTYLFLELKNSIKVLGKSIIGMLIMIAFLAIGVTAVSYGLLQSQVFQKVDVAVAIPKEEKEMRVVTQYISNMDSVKSICDFLYMDEEAAWDELEQGNVQAVIAFPENFFEDVYVGKNTPAGIYFTDSEAANIQVFKELLKTGISYLQISEAGVYASLEMQKEYGTTMERGTLGDYVAGLYAKEILKRERTFEKEVISPFGTFDYEEYYFSAVLLMVLLMSGLQFGYLYRKQSRIIGQKLKVEGIGPGAVSVVRILVMGLVLWILASCVYGLTKIVSDFAGYNIIAWKGPAVGGMLVLCISIAAYFHAIYALAGSSMNGTLLILVCNLVMILCSGVLIPAAYLPDAAAGLGAILPLHFWNQHCSNLVFGETTFWAVLQLVGMSVIGTGIGTVALWKNT